MKNERQKMLDNLWIRVMLAGISIIIFFTLCYFLRGTLISLLMAFIVAYIFDPAVDFFERKTWPFTRKHIQRGFGIVFIIITVLLTTAGFLTYAIPKTVSGIYQVGGMIKDHYPKYQASLESWVERYKDTEFGRTVKLILQEFKEPVSGMDSDKTKSANMGESEEGKSVSSQDAAHERGSDVKRTMFVQIAWKFKKYLPNVVGFLTNSVRNIFYSTFGFFDILLNFIIFSIVSVYLLKDFNIIAKSIKDFFPASKRDHAVRVLSRVNDNLRHFLRGQLVVCLILSLIYSIGLTIAGVPLSFLLGFAGGFGNLIPYVGTGTGILLASVLSVFHFHDFTHIVYVLITFGAGQMLEATVITPRIMGKGLGLSPVMVILSILICSQLFGFLGLLLAVPIASTVKVFVDEIISKYKSSEYYKG
ncbi:MAG: AI-2E family transporter [Candidatus Brocadiaceae bacterium]|nr:AI-2E family transporter [Candidatus Brocadiaceae bacterium]